MSFERLSTEDSDLKVRKDFPELTKKWNTPASADSLAKTVKALEERKFKVTVVDDAAGALKAVTDAIAEKSTFFSGGSQTLDEIGYVDWAKSQTKAVNLKAQYLEAQGKNDWAAAGALQKKGYTADNFISSVAAVSEQGDLTWGSLTGSRVVVNGPTNVILVAGTNKIVKSYDEAVKRLYEWQLPVESARIKIAYKITTGSAITDFGAVRGANPWGTPGHIHVVLIKGTFGF